MGQLDVIKELIDKEKELEAKYKEIKARDDALTVACVLCGLQCQPPFGDSQFCNVCRSKPTGDDMATIVY